jgi:hypothetical protein
MPRTPLTALWDTITEIYFINPAIAGWTPNGKSFYISHSLDDREFLTATYFKYASQYRKNAAVKWRSLSKLIDTYATIEDEMLERRRIYTIKYFIRNKRDMLPFCIMKPQYRRGKVDIN